MTLYAAIDIGTNSTRLLVGDCKRQKVKVCYKALHNTRLGEGLGKNKVLSPRSQSRTINILKEYLNLLRLYPRIEIKVVATSAVREAENKTEFLERVKKETGLAVNIISGEEEASLSYRGAVSEFPAFKKPIVLDIGGGSTEITFPDSKGTLKHLSTNIGAVIGTEKNLRFDNFRKHFHSWLPRFNFLQKNMECIGVGGTITTLAAIDLQLAVYNPQKIHGYCLKSSRLKEIFKKLAACSPQEREHLPGMQPGRADIILAGATILGLILNYWEAKKIIVSEADLLYGMILQMDAKSRKHN